MKRVRIIVKGKVQGVGFRQFTKEQATRLSITGWVRNEHNGNVQLEAQGTEDQIEELLSCCRKGPSWSRVDELEWEEIDATEGDPFFSITYV